MIVQSQKHRRIKIIKSHAIGVTKGADSINYGIGIVQEENYLVTSSSKNLIDEFQKYNWAKRQKTNEPLNKPIDKYNHAMDALIP